MLSGPFPTDQDRGSTALRFKGFADSSSLAPRFRSLVSSSLKLRAGCGLEGSENWLDVGKRPRSLSLRPENQS